MPLPPETDDQILKELIDVMNSSHQLRAIIDAVSIQNVKARYGLAVDRFTSDERSAAAEIRTLFCDSGTADYGAGPLVGHEAIIGFLHANIAATKAMVWHSFHSPLIEVGEMEADAQWTITAKMRSKESDEIETVIGRYADRFVRAAEGWRIASLHFTPDE